MKRVLFLEDSKDLCAIYAQIIHHNENIHAEYCKTPDEIIKALPQQWDLIISDLDIPGITTSEIIKLTKSKLVFLTGGEPNSVTASHKVYQKENLIKLIPKILAENL